MTRKFYLIDGVRIDVVDVEPTNDVRFLSQRQLRAAATPEARAELARRAAMVKKIIG
jgi:hypothetical protein